MIRTTRGYSLRSGRPSEAIRERNLPDDRAHPPRGREGGSRKLDHGARLAQGYVDLRVGERDLGLLPIAVARGHPHGLAETPVPRQRRTRVVVCLAVLSVPAMVLGGFVARRWEWRFPIVETWNPLLPAVLVLAFLVFFFAALDSSPFIYFSSEAGGTRDRASPSRAILVLIDHQGDGDPALFVGRHRRIVEGAHANGLHARELH